MNGFWVVFILGGVAKPRGSPSGAWELGAASDQAVGAAAVATGTTVVATHNSSTT